MRELERFKKLFDETFYNKPKLQTDKFYDIWFDLELQRDWLCGPLYSIYTSGNCDYVFKDKDGRFPEVIDLESFLKWCIELVQKYQSQVINIQTTTSQESEDKEIILQHAQKMKDLSRLAYEIQKEHKN